MTNRSPQNSSPSPAKPGWEALLLAVLVIALVQITSFAEGTLGTLRQDVLAHPILGNLVPPPGEEALWPFEPLGVLGIALALGALLLYLLVDLAAGRRQEGKGLHGWTPWVPWTKWTLLLVIIATSVVGPTLKLALLRDSIGPGSYSHDGGVIQTEATLAMLFAGQNPYVEDYTETPMAVWGLPEFRTALYHYPYLPWTFLFSAPFYALGQALGFYDQRLVYLLLLAIALALAPRLFGTQRIASLEEEPVGRDEAEQGSYRSRRGLAIVALLALNPIMGLHVIFGQNDVFVLSWIVFSLAAWRGWQRRAAVGDERATRWRWASAALFGVACASKPTAWFFAPFYGLLLVADERDLLLSGWRGLLRLVPKIVRRAWPALLVFGLILAPYVVDAPWHFYDDVFRWSSGAGETGYQIWGWGGSNFVLAFGGVVDRFVQWPFWITEVALAGPLLGWLVHRQQRDNTLANACWHYGLLLLAFFYASRFLNENYLGYIFAFLALGWVSGMGGEEANADKSQW